MNENKFWICIWVLLSITLSFLFFLIAHYSNKSEEKIVDLIKSGVNPIEAHCAISMTQSNSLVCMSLIKNKN